MSDLVDRLLARNLDRLNAQALELCAEISGLRRENERLRGLLRECRTLLIRRDIAYPGAIDAAIAGAADQPTVCDWPACGCKRGSDYECAQGYARPTSTDAARAKLNSL